MSDTSIWAPSDDEVTDAAIWFCDPDFARELGLDCPDSLHPLDVGVSYPTRVVLRHAYMVKRLKERGIDVEFIRGS